MIDLLVVGAGPAGLATALSAAAQGLETVVIDARTGSIDKACGEGLMPGAVRSLAALGVHPAGLDFRGIRYTDGRRSVETTFGSGPGRGVRRTTLHHAMTEAVEEAGIEIRQGQITSVTQDGVSVRAGGITARFLAAADGLHSPIARQLGLHVPNTHTDRRWGLRQHFHVEPWTDLVEVHWAADSEAYVTPVGPNTVGVAVLSGRRSPFADHLDAFGDLRERLGAARPLARPLGAGPLRQKTRRRTAGRVLLVGDAAGYVDALTGEGIAVSLSCARELVRCVAAGRPGDYEARWRRESRPYRSITHALLLAAGLPAVRRTIVPAARKLPAVFGALVDQLAR